MDRTKKNPCDIAPSPVLNDRRGGSLLEVVVALVVLSLGMMGMASTTAVVVKQTTISEITNRRVAAAQMVAERLRSMPFDSIAAGSGHYGDFDAAWTVTSTNFRAKQVRIITEGPMVSDGVASSIAAHAADTLSYTVVR